MCCMWKTMDMCRTEPSTLQGLSKVKARSYVQRNIRWCFPGLRSGKDKQLCRRITSRICMAGCLPGSCPGCWCLMGDAGTWTSPPAKLFFPVVSLGHAGTTVLYAAVRPPPAERGIVGDGSASGKGLAQGCCWRERAELCARKN